MHDCLPGLSVTNDGEFCLLWTKFQSDTIHPFLNASKTLSELSNTGIKVPGIRCQLYLGVIGIKMMGNIETGNYMAEGGSVKSEKQWTQDRTLRDPIKEREGIREAITQFNLLSTICEI